MLVEHPLSLYHPWCAGVEGCAAVRRCSQNLRMLVEHPLSFYHPGCAGVGYVYRVIQQY
jgi:hypothetical protein